jgi:hypothetical protein
MNTTNGNFIENSIPDTKNATIALNIGGVDSTMSVANFATAITPPASGPTYKVYTAKVDMASGSETVFENTLGATLAWTVSSGQISTGVIGSLIGQNNVYVQVNSSTSSSTPKIVSGAFNPSPWIVNIKQTDNAGVNDSTQSVYVEIRVYN